MNAQRSPFAVWFAVLALVGCRDAVEPPHVAAASFTKSDRVQVDETGSVLTIDHQVPHVSTVPGHKGQLVHLFVRERVRGNPGDGKPRKAVLMVHGLSVPVVALMGLSHDDYDWALRLARSGGFDVFMVDLQGSGRSRPPEMDGLSVLADPCNVPLDQRSLVPVWSPPCKPNQANYPFQLGSSRSDWDELDTVVDYIRALRGVDKVALVGASAGSARVGPYAARHTNKVESLFLYAAFYPDPNAPGARAGTGPYGYEPPIDSRTGKPFVLPQPGTPMILNSRSEFMNAWNREIACDGQIEADIQDVVWRAIMDDDAIGRTWGPPDGVQRVARGQRTFFGWGWNSGTARAISVPTLIIHGTSDLSVPPNQLRLYDDLTGIPGDRRLLFRVECAGHFMVWERQRRVLHHISKQWLKHGAVDGHTTGKFSVDTEGVISKVP